LVYSNVLFVWGHPKIPAGSGMKAKEFCSSVTKMTYSFSECVTELLHWMDVVNIRAEITFPSQYVWLVWETGSSELK